MGVTKFSRLDATMNLQVVSSLPATPAAYYGISSNDIDSVEWASGEVVWHSGDRRMYIQTSTSGRTAVWKRLLTQFNSSTTSTSTSTSSTTSSTSSSTSSTSSSTSSTSTSSSTSSTTSSSTSSSSTTTMA